MNWLWFMSVLALFAVSVPCCATLWCSMYCAVRAHCREQLLRCRLKHFASVLLLLLLLLCLMSASLYDQKFKVPLFDGNPVEGERNKFFDSSTPIKFHPTWFVLDVYVYFAFAMLQFNVEHKIEYNVNGIKIRNITLKGWMVTSSLFYAFAVSVAVALDYDVSKGMRVKWISHFEKRSSCFSFCGFDSRNCGKFKTR